MSRKNRTNRAGAAAGLSPHQWQNGGKRKRPKGVGAPMGEFKANVNIITRIIRGRVEDCQDGKQYN